MSRALFDELIDDWARGRLPASEAAEFEALLSADPDLRAEAEEHRRLLEVIAAAPPVRAPKGLLEEALRRARSDEEIPDPFAGSEARVIPVVPPGGAASSRRSASRPWAMAAAVAALLVVGGGSMLLMRSEAPVDREAFDIAAARDERRALGAPEPDAAPFADAPLGVAEQPPAAVMDRSALAGAPPLPDDSPPDDATEAPEVAAAPVPLPPPERLESERTISEDVLTRLADEQLGKNGPDEVAALPERLATARSRALAAELTPEDESEEAPEPVGAGTPGGSPIPPEDYAFLVGQASISGGLVVPPSTPEEPSTLADVPEGAMPLAFSFQAEFPDRAALELFLDRLERASELARADGIPGQSDYRPPGSSAPGRFPGTTGLMGDGRPSTTDGTGFDTLVIGESIDVPGAGFDLSRYHTIIVRDPETGTVTLILHLDDSPL